MNFRRILARKLAMVIPVMVIVTLAITLVAMPAGALNQSSALSGVGEILNSPGPVPAMINYQGYLTDSDGNPINGTLEMTFSIYEDAVGGTALWTETHSSVTVTDGLFNVLLGSVNPINSTHLTGESYLGVQVGSDPEMTPRQQIVSVAYSFHADNTDNLDGMDSADFVAVAGDTMTGQLVLPADGLVAGTDQLVLAYDSVGIGTTDPGVYKLKVDGIERGVNGICAIGVLRGVYGKQSDTGNYGVLGNIDYGVHGQHIDSGNYGQLGTSSYGVYGRHGTSGNYGVLGNIDYGVHGKHIDSGNFGHLGTSSAGVSGYSSSGSGLFGLSDSYLGVYGQSSNGTGVYGYTSSGYGVYGLHNTSGNYGRLGTSDEGVYGYGNNWGVYGASNGSGVYGQNITSGNFGRLGTSSYGVYGYGTNHGVHGASDGNAGVYGYGNAGVYGYGNDYGVYGTSTSVGVYGSSSGGYALYGISSSGVGVNGEHSGSGNYGRLGTPGEGVYGSGDTYGVYGNNSGSGYGVYGYSIEGRGVQGDSGIIGVFGAGGTWDFYAGGAGTNYGPFTGSHEVKFADDFPQDIRSGMIVSVTGEAQLRTDEGEISYSSTLPTVQLSETPNDKKVAGVITSEAPLPKDHWYQASEGERFGIVNALGEGRVWVTNVNGDIEAGDYITTSSIAGYGQMQDDDLLHSYTLGKAIETVDWSQVTETVEFNGQTYKAYAIAVFYTSG